MLAVRAEMLTNKKYEKNQLKNEKSYFPKVLYCPKD